MKRLSVAFLGVAILSAWGMPFHPPCCGFRDSVRTILESNCCPIQSCPLAQARGAAPASIAKADSLDSSPPIHLEPAVASIPRRGLWDSPVFAESRSSPPRACPTSALLSVFRV